MIDVYQQSVKTENEVSDFAALYNLLAADHRSLLQEVTTVRQVIKFELKEMEIVRKGGARSPLTDLLLQLTWGFDG